MRQEKEEKISPTGQRRFKKKGKSEMRALTNRMAKKTRRFYRRSDRIYEYGQQSFVSRKRDTHELRLASQCD